MVKTFFNNGEYDDNKLKKIIGDETTLTKNAIVAPNNLTYPNNDALSNGEESRQNAITNFEIFNPYIHYLPINNSAVKIDFTTQFDEIANKFNVYSKKYRKDI